SADRERADVTREVAPPRRIAGGTRVGLPLIRDSAYGDLLPRPGGVHGDASIRAARTAVVAGEQRPDAWRVDVPQKTRRIVGVGGARRMKVVVGIRPPGNTVSAGRGHSQRVLHLDGNQAVQIAEPD